MAHFTTTISNAIYLAKNVTLGDDWDRGEWDLAEWDKTIDIAVNAINSKRISKSKFESLIIGVTVHGYKRYGIWYLVFPDGTTDCLGVFGPTYTEQDAPDTIWSQTVNSSTNWSLN